MQCLHKSVHRYITSYFYLKFRKWMVGLVVIVCNTYFHYCLKTSGNVMTRHIMYQMYMGTFHSSLVICFHCEYNVWRKPSENIIMKHIIYWLYKVTFDSSLVIYVHYEYYLKTSENTIMKHIMYQLYMDAFNSSLTIWFRTYKWIAFILWGSWTERDFIFHLMIQWDM